MIGTVITPQHLLDAWQAELDAHADDPLTGACPLCHRHLCKTYQGARAGLAMSGVLDWDPLRQRTTGGHT